MADTFVDVALYGAAYRCGGILYASLYPSTGEKVGVSSISPEDLDQSIRRLYDYPFGARRIHHYRMKLEVYFGVPHLSFFPADCSKIELGKDHIRRIVEKYRRRKSLPPVRISWSELEEMVCHDGKWYANEDELERELEQKQAQEGYGLWAVPDWMLEPKPPKRIVRRRKRRIN